MAGKKKYNKLVKRGQLPYAVCTVSVCPVRIRPSDTEEQITQVLWGECLEVIVKKHNSWMKVRCLWDNYEGWIDSKQVVRISNEEKDEYLAERVYSLDLVQSVSTKNHTIPILLGSILPKFDGLHCYLHDDKFMYNGSVVDPIRFSEIKPDLIERIARKYMHAPYLWGGRSAFGIDCSGFTQKVYQLLGYKLPRDAAQQVQEGIIIDFLETARIGDLAFFENEDKKIIHVGIILPGAKIIHASGKVRIDTLDHEGIYNNELKKYTHKFRVAKRYLQLDYSEE